MATAARVRRLGGWTRREPLYEETGYAYVSQPHLHIFSLAGNITNHHRAAGTLCANTIIGLAHDLYGDKLYKSGLFVKISRTDMTDFSKNIHEINVFFQFSSNRSRTQ